MLKSTALAGLFFTTLNFFPAAIPVAQADPIAATSAASQPAPPISSLKPLVVASAVTAASATLAAPAMMVEHGITLTAAETQFVTLINAERTSRGENALTVDPLLVTTARSHSREMSSLNYFDHHSPTPGMQTPMDRYLKGLHDTCASVPSYLLVGENIYYCSVFNDHYNVAYGHDALMHSPGHRANILDARFTKIGVGIYQDASGQFWLTQMFMKNQP